MGFLEDSVLAVKLLCLQAQEPTDCTPETQEQYRRAGILGSMYLLAAVAVPIGAAAVVQYAQRLREPPTVFMESLEARAPYRSATLPVMVGDSLCDVIAHAQDTIALGDCAPKQTLVASAGDTTRYINARRP